MLKRPGSFFDLGGTLLALDEHNEIAVNRHGQATLLTGVRERLASLAGSPVFVVSNQAGIAEGTLSSERLDGFCSQLSAATGAITAYAICTHARDAGCGCRKPRPGLVIRLAEAHDIDLTRSVMIGDTRNDQELATAAGIGSFYWAADYFAP